MSGSGLFPLKGVTQDPNPLRMTMCLWSARLSFTMGLPITLERIAIEKLNGTLVAERRAPQDSFSGHQMTTPWNPLHYAYYNCLREKFSGKPEHQAQRRRRAQPTAESPARLC